MSFRWLAIVAVLLLLNPIFSPAAEPEFRVIHTTQGSFADVKQGLELAITGRGLVISHYSDVGTMLSRTGEDVGSGREVYLDAGVIEFCSAVMSRKMMEADPANLIFCPYAIAVYVRPEDPETVYVAYERLSRAAAGGTTALLEEVETLLEAIVQEGMAF